MKKRTSSIFISYRALRRLIGILGMTLPIIVISGGFFGGFGVLDSISDYYHSNMRDYFTGLMFTVGYFLITYKGYTSLDDLITNISGFFAICIALFPVIPHYPVTGRLGVFCLSQGLSSVLHALSAFAFSILLAFNSICLFTRSGENPSTPEKLKRNILYIACGITILAAVLASAVFFLFLRESFIAQLRPVLFFETAALEAFGISWFVKGDTILTDS